MRSTNHHQAVIVKHRAKLVERLTSEKRNQKMDAGIEWNESQLRREAEEREKESYMNFIYRLLARMDIESLRRMMDAAINEI